jgi:hypothetical protein
MADASGTGYDRDAVLRVYDGMASDYAIRYGAELREPDSDTEFLDAALADIPAGPVLDVGCGPAQVGTCCRRLSHRSPRRRAHQVGTDPCRARAAGLRRHCGRRQPPGRQDVAPGRVARHPSRGERARDRGSS